jgi:cell division protease FtsH
MQVSLASRASELIFLGEAMDGFQGDLANATRLANMMVNEMGMNGSMVYRPTGGIMGMPGGMPDPRSVERLLDQNFMKVKLLLEENRASVIAVAEALIEKHSLIGDEIYELIAQAEARTNGHTPNGHVQVPPADAPAFEMAPGGQQRYDLPN